MKFANRVFPILVLGLLCAVLLLHAGCASTGYNGGGGAKTTVPAAPMGLTATAGNAQVTLNWTASSGATGYYVKRSMTSGGPYTQIATLDAATDTDTGLTNGTKYYYVVSAYNSAGQSANSAGVSATPTLSTPPVPTGLAATAGNGVVSLAWTGSSGAITYSVKRSTSSGTDAQIAAPTSTSYTDTSVTNGTIYYYVVSAVNSVGPSANSTQVSATPAAPVANVTVTINPAQTKPISPWIYGVNAYSEVTGTPPGLTFDRAGASRWTAYNWETNASNGGSDYFYENDDNLSSSTVPDEAVRSFIARDQSNGMATLMTVPLQGLVAADENGPVSLVNPPDMSRFKVLVDQKSTVSSAPFTVNPPTSGADVFADESVWALNQKFPGMGIFGSNPALPTFVCLDNEPELWNEIHPEVQGPNPITPGAFITKTITMTEALKRQFPDIVIFGPVNYGFLGMWYWQGEISPTPSGANWFADQYLTALSSASTTFGKPLVDVYDFHWYAQEYDVNGVQSLI